MATSHSARKGRRKTFSSPLDDSDDDWGDFSGPVAAGTADDLLAGNPGFQAADLLQDMKETAQAQKSLPNNAAWDSEDDEDDLETFFSPPSSKGRKIAKKHNMRTKKTSNTHHNNNNSVMLDDNELVEELRKAASYAFRRLELDRERQRIQAEELLKATKEAQLMEMNNSTCADLPTAANEPSVAIHDSSIALDEMIRIDDLPQPLPVPEVPNTLANADVENLTLSRLEKPLPDIPEANTIEDELCDTKALLSPRQRIAYVGLVYLILAKYTHRNEKGWERTTEFASAMNFARRLLKRLYQHMDMDKNEQKMIEQMSTHGVLPSDMAHSLTVDGTKVSVKTAFYNADTGDIEVGRKSMDNVLSPTSSNGRPASFDCSGTSPRAASVLASAVSDKRSMTPPVSRNRSSTSGSNSRLNDRNSEHLQTIQLDIRWTIVTDLFLQLIADCVYDSRGRSLLRQVAEQLELEWWDTVALEKRISEQLRLAEEMAEKLRHEESRSKVRNKEGRGQRWAAMGLATLGGGLILGLSAGLLAPVIGAGLAAGFTSIGVAGTGAFLGQAGGMALITSGGVIAGGTMGGQKMAKRTMGIRTFIFHSMFDNRRPNVLLCISGMLTRDEDYSLPFSTIDPIVGDVYTLEWEPKMLKELNDVLKILAGEIVGQAVQTVLGHTMLSTLMAGLSWPLMLTKLGYLVDNPWSVGLDRAKKAGLILADTLVSHGHGQRPISLAGFSLGARVIFFCLQELARMNAFGIVEDVYLYGTPVTANDKQWREAVSVIGGRFVNCYHRNDWVLGMFNLV